MKKSIMIIDISVLIATAGLFFTIGYYMNVGNKVDLSEYRQETKYLNEIIHQKENEIADQSLIIDSLKANRQIANNTELNTNEGKVIT